LSAVAAPRVNYYGTIDPNLFERAVFFTLLPTGIKGSLRRNFLQSASPLILNPLFSYPSSFFCAAYWAGVRADTGRHPAFPPTRGPGKEDLVLRGPRTLDGKRKHESADLLPRRFVRVASLSDDAHSLLLHSLSILEEQKSSPDQKKLPCATDLDHLHYLSPSPRVLPFPIAFPREWYSLSTGILPPRSPPLSAGWPA